jgi:glyoxylase-like metal-dependent hydrolase (beta-lactamase superfamily II)
MEKWTIAENVVQYHFPDSETPDKLDDHILVFLNGDKAVLLDSGYEHEAAQIKADLDAQGIEVEKILLSHYHPDHFDGAQIFPEAELWISRGYQWLHEHYRAEYPDEYVPEATHEIEDGEKLQFGDFEFEFVVRTGHSFCSLLTLINGQYMQVGDLIMVSDSDKLSLPYIGDDGNFQDYINSLVHIDEHAPKTVLLSHGHPITNKASLSQHIDWLLYYLNCMMESKGSLPVEECLKGSPEMYSGLNFHKINTKRV